jgi:hypothetical protein
MKYFDFPSEKYEICALSLQDNNALRNIRIARGRGLTCEFLGLV